MDFIGDIEFQSNVTKLSNDTVIIKITVWIYIAAKLINTKWLQVAKFELVYRNFYSRQRMKLGGCVIWRLEKLLWKEESKVWSAAKLGGMYEINTDYKKKKRVMSNNT